MKTKKTIKIALTILLLTIFSGITAQAQGDFVRWEYQINKGCTADEWDLSFDGRNTYLYEKVNGKDTFTEIDRAITSERRMAFTFKLKKDIEGKDTARVEKGKMIEFETEGPIVPNSDVYAIYYRAINDYQNPINADKYLLPVCPNDLPVDVKEMDVSLIPASKYFLKEKLIETSPKKAVDRNPIRSTVKKISNMKLNTSNLEVGFYWFTLQTLATVEMRDVMGGPTYTRQYAKTTPPVLIEIYKDRNTPPTIKLDTNAKICKSPYIKAIAKDDDNKPDSKKTPQKLSINWEITNSEGGMVEFERKSLGDPMSAEYAEEITIKDFSLGTYTIKATAFDGIDYSKDDQNNVGTIQKLDVVCRAGSMIYFQFAIPYESLDYNVYKLSDYLNPDTWTNNKRGKQCENPYPNSEYADFYKKYLENQIPSMVQTNYAKLEDVIKDLKNKTNYSLEIVGYADFEKGKGYDNYKLVERRIEVVREYLIRRLREENSPVNVITDGIAPVNKGDSEAKDDSNYRCAEGRRHDRRVELFYYIEGQRPKIANYIIIDDLNAD